MLLSWIWAWQLVIRLVVSTTPNITNMTEELVVSVVPNTLLFTGYTCMLI
jgi:hypothetical protein